MTGIQLREGSGHLPIVKTLAWRDEAGTRDFAAALAAQSGIRDCFIALRGDLGAGKTSFVRHLLQALGVRGRIKSPTYAVVEPYTVLPETGPPDPLDIWHFDFYRFNDPREWEDAGFRDLFASPGLKLVEWPERVQALLPHADLELHIAIAGETERQVRVVARSAVGERLLAGALR